MNSEFLPATQSSITPAVNLLDRYETLKQQAAHTPELWQPETGDSLIGEIVGHQKAVGAYGENYQMLIRDENGTVIAAWLTQWLKDNLKVQGAESGDLIALTFLGKKSSPAGRSYNAYSLIVDKGLDNE